MIRIRILRVGGRGEPLPLPRHMTPGSAGVDLCADVEVTLAPGQRALVPTGLLLEIPPGYEGQVRPRSGLALRHGVTVLNAPGTIDSDYRGEVSALLIHHGDEPITLRRGERVAQLVIAKVERVEWEEAETLSETTRGAGGFGHSGR